MPAKVFVVEKKADKSLSKLPLHVQSRIVHIFDIIKANPIIGAKLHGELSQFYKVRVGDYRIIYRFDSSISTVIVVKIEHRQGVYK